MHGVGRIRDALRARTAHRKVKRYAQKQYCDLPVRHLG
jgi:hypothetical protein